MIRRRLTRALIVAVLGLAVTCAAGYLMRRPILERIGSVLASDDPPATSDVIVISVDVGAAGILEAADLVRAGIASRVAVFSDPPDAIDREFIKRGLAHEDKTALAVKQLTALGITQVEQIPIRVNGTESEGRVLPQWCAARGYRSVVIVTGSDHARRVGRVMRREVRSTGTRVLVKAARYSEFEPQRWWQTRNGARVGIIETQKLLLDLLLHPLS